MVERVKAPLEPRSFTENASLERLFATRGAFHPIGQWQPESV